MTHKTSLFDTVGGLPVLRQVHHEFYNRLYAHAWLGQYFAGTKQHLIEEKQTMFMAEKMGGPHRFIGHAPELAHRRMYIPDRLFNLRQTILLETLLTIKRINSYLTKLNASSTAYTC